MIPFCYFLRFFLFFSFLSFYFSGTPSADVSTYVPAGADITSAELAKLRAGCNPLVQWLESAEDDDESEEEED